MVAPLITIFVRHSAGCKYAGDEFCKRCNCRKHLRWTQNGKQYRRKAGTRSWVEAETVKRDLEDQLSGRTAEKPQGPRTIEDAIKALIADKKAQGVTDGVLGRYETELERLRKFAERKGVLTVAGLTPEFLVAYRETWDALYKSSITRREVQKRVKTLLQFSYDMHWIDRVPKMSSIQVDEPPTMPLSKDEYARLLAAIPKTFTKNGKADRVRAFVQLMRWSGLSIADALQLRRDELIHDKAKKLYRIVTSRQKTGTDVSVPIPPGVAAELLAVKSKKPEYFFWEESGGIEGVKTEWSRSIRRAFEEAKIRCEGHMVSHRLRDTFAVDLLEKGVPLEEVSKLLGHTSIKTTEKSYAKWVKGRQDRLDSLVIATWD